jgi:p-aminobenzoyl-glutamate transporter AbgT
MSPAPEKAKLTKKEHDSIKVFALVCVAVSSVFIMYMVVWSTNLLSQKDWCDRAMGAAKEADISRPEYAVSACFALLKQQVSALSNNALIYAGVIALCLLALMVIVVAGGQLSFRGPGGVGANIGN